MDKYDRMLLWGLAISFVAAFLGEPMVYGYIMAVVFPIYFGKVVIDYYKG